MGDGVMSKDGKSLNELVLSAFTKYAFHNSIGKSPVAEPQV